MKDLIQKILDYKNKYWIVIDSETLNKLFTETEKALLREKNILKKLSQVRLYLIWNNFNKSEDLLIIMNKLSIVKYYQLKYSAFLSPTTFFNLFENHERVLDFKLLSLNWYKVNRVVKIGQLKIEIVDASKIYYKLLEKKYTQNYSFWNIELTGVLKSFYLLFDKFDGSQLSQQQLDFLKENKNILDYRIKLKEIEIKPTYDDSIFLQSQFKYLDVFKEKIYIFKKQLKELNFQLPKFNNDKEYLEYINSQKENDIYNTTTIEGEEINYEELKELLEKEDKSKFEKKPNKLQIIWYKDAFENLLEGKIYLNEDGIKKIHYDMFKPLYDYGFVKEPTGGIYSRTQRYIGYRTPYMIAKKIQPMIPPSPEKITYCMELLNEFLEKDKDLNVFEKALIFHIIFIEIHPFPDWNGRTTRLFFNNLLFSEKIWWVVIPWQERDTYFDRINTAIIEKDITDFANYYYNKLINWNSPIKIYR